MIHYEFRLIWSPDVFTHIFGRDPAKYRLIKLFLNNYLNIKIKKY
jgi:hypothetical protein